MNPRNLYWYCIHVIRTKIRSFMTPMTIDEAQEKRELIAKLYCASAFLSLVYITFKIGKENKNFDYDTNKPTPIDVLKKLQVKGDVKIISFEGFKKVDEYMYNQDTSNEISRSNTVEETPEIYVG